MSARLPLSLAILHAHTTRTLKCLFSPSFFCLKKKVQFLKSGECLHNVVGLRKMMPQKGSALPSQLRVREVPLACNYFL